MSNAKCLTIRMAAASRTAWNFLLQKGFYLTSNSGMTIRQFLVETVGYENCFIDETVRTVFLNSSPVDDIDAAHVKDGDRIALGSAMPGLVGICMGRDNPYKSFRSDIACEGEDGTGSGVESIRVFVKVFSTLAVETGEAILRQGIEARVVDLAKLFEEQADLLIDGDIEGLPTTDDATVTITVEFE